MGDALFLLALLALPFTPALVTYGVAAVVCDSYNFLSNDLCDEWRYDPPPAEGLPLPHGWTVRSHDLSCGSGGCPTRDFTIASQKRLGDPVRAYAADLGSLGWEIREGRTEGRTYFLGRKENLVVLISAVSRIGAARGSDDREHHRVEVSFALADEGGMAYE